MLSEHVYAALLFLERQTVSTFMCVCVKPAKHVLSLLAASADNKVVALN